jgi:ADP-heptose:LPS heptosyltransferase
MFAVRAPDHLGDGVMALAAVQALARLGPLRVYAPPWGRELYAGLDVRPVQEAPPDGAIGVLFKPSFGAAWRWRHLERRVGLDVHGRGVLLTDRVPEPRGHRRDGYARVAERLGAHDVGPSRYRPRAPSPDDVPPGFVALAAWGATPAARWPHARALADRLAQERPVRFLAGPGEETAVARMAGPHAMLAIASLPALASALDRAAVVIGNDTGLAHFAAACGVPVVTVHGSTDPARTGPGVPVVSSRPTWCSPCYRKTCPFGVACLARVGIDEVLAAARAAARAELP